jgi:hypothetical protein
MQAKAVAMDWGVKWMAAALRLAANAKRCPSQPPASVNHTIGGTD